MSQILNVYQIRDNKANVFILPLYDVNDGCVVRQVKKLLSNPQFKENAQDYDLFKCATFDDDTGIYKALNIPTQVLNLSSLIEV